MADTTFQMPNYDESVVPLNHPAADMFHECFKSQGGRLTDTAKYVEFSNFIEYFRRRCWFGLNRLNVLLPPNALQSTYFDFIANRNLNAIASSSMSYDLVGLYSGSILNLAVLFFILLSHPEVLPELGDPSKETAWFDDLSDCEWTGTLSKVFSAIRPRSDALNFPKDPARYSAAALMATIALDFLFFHEIGHLVLGHIDYLANLTGDRVFTEVRTGQFLLPETSHGLELQADEFAALISLGTCFGIDSSQTPQAFPSTAEAIRRWTFAVGLLFLVFDRGDTRVAAHKDQDHPHSAVRLMNVFRRSINGAVISGSPATELHDAWQLAVKDLGSVSLRFNMGSAVWYVSGAEHDEISKSLVELSNHWTSIAQEVKSYSRLVSRE